MKMFYKNSRTTIAIIVFSLIFSFTLSITAFAAGPNGVNLGTSGNYVILAKTGISTTGPTSVVGDLGLSPAAASYITGFALTLPISSVFSTSALVTGKIYASDYEVPTPINTITAVSDMQTAYTDAMGRTNPTATELGAGNIGGLTIAPGLYKWGTSVTIPTDVTLSGNANDVWIFQIAQNLNISSATKVVLSGGAQASNIFWVVAGNTTIGTTAVFNGNILDQTAIVLNTGAKLNGRALAQTAVTLDSNFVVFPSYTVTIPVVTPTPISNSTLTITSTVPTQTTISGCNGIAGFSTVTGKSCSGNTVLVTTTTRVVILGCSGTTGFSTVTGQSCINNSGSVITTTSYNFGPVVLKQGSKGESVKEIQRFLNKVFKMNLKIDGKLGKATVTLVKKWQKDNGLVADGFIGVKTKAKMNAEIE